MFRDIQKNDGAVFRARFRLPADAMVVLSVGRLAYVKGYDILLRAFARSDFMGAPAYLAIVGDGEEREKLTSLTQELGITGKVVFTGWLKDTRDAMAGSDVFALASRNEGMGRVFVEAMAAGLPVVGTRTGGIPALIRDGVTGLLADKDDIDSLAKAITTLVGDARLRSELGRNGREFVYPAFDENTMIESLARVYSDVLNN